MDDYENDYEEDDSGEGRNAMSGLRPEVDKNSANYATQCSNEAYKNLSSAKKIKRKLYCEYLKHKLYKSNKNANNEEKYSQGGNKSRKSRKHKSRKHKSRKHKSRKSRKH